MRCRLLLLRWLLLLLRWLLLLLLLLLLLYWLLPMCRVPLLLIRLLLRLKNEVCCSLNITATRLQRCVGISQRNLAQLCQLPRCLLPPRQGRLPPRQGRLLRQLPLLPLPRLLPLLPLLLLPLRLRFVLQKLPLQPAAYIGRPCCLIARSAAIRADWLRPAPLEGRHQQVSI